MSFGHHAAVRGRWLYRILGGAVFALAVAGTGALVWAAVLAAQERLIPTWIWVFVAGVCVIAGVIAAALRHGSGEYALMRGYRERRRRGTRIALDWKYRTGSYTSVPGALAFGFFGGIGQLGQDAWWKQVGGACAAIAAVVAAGALVRWLLLPVDPDSRAALDRRYAELQWDWGWMGRKITSRRHRRRDR